MKKAAVCLVAVAALTALPCRADEDTILKTKVGPVDVGLFIPADTKPLRGLYVHAAHYRIKSTDRWARYLGATDPPQNHKGRTTLGARKTNPNQNKLSLNCLGT